MNNYQDLLEFPSNYKFGMETFTNKHILITSIENFLLKYHPKNIIVSLSGGVDSMVLLGLLLTLQSEHNFKLTTASINYNLRDEAQYEIKFIKDYTLKYQKEIPINYISNISGYSRKKENSGKRSEFEEQSRNIRFELYHKIIKDNNWLHEETIIMVGHHQDDLIENIFNNFMQGRDLTDLPVMKDISINREIKIGRPLLSHYKDDIYDYAHKNNIPYFKNTTPEWSKRGQMRDVLFPLLDKIYNCNWKQKMLNHGIVSDTLDHIIKSNLEIDMANKNSITNQIGFTKKDILNWNQYLWSKKLSEILHSHGLKMVSQKALKIFIANIKKDNHKGFFNDKINYQINCDTITINF